MPALLRLEADQAFSRAAGAPLVAGNQVTLLRDARENYPAWLDAIVCAEKPRFAWRTIRASEDKGRAARGVRTAHPTRHPRREEAANCPGITPV